jgi:hypothetical protein
MEMWAILTQRTLKIASQLTLIHSNAKSNPAIFANEANLWLIFKESSITFSRSSV